MSLPFLCPICRLPLAGNGASLRCEKRHCFDLASEGYVHLAPGKSDAGDSAAMCRARRDFLAAGFYRPFAEAIASLLKEHRVDAVCDLGCGEGFYLRTLRSTLPKATLVGLDLAKTSIRLAAKAEKDKENPIAYAVAGIFDTPLPDMAFDAVLSVFAPVPDREAHRLLRQDGLLIVAHPGKNHLMGLKRLLYDNPYENEEKDFTFPCFIKQADHRVSYTVEVPQAQLGNLFLMTPYAWKTSKTDAEKLTSVTSLVTELDFLLSVYQKI